jgi:putative superfamily III holin-X
MRKSRSVASKKGAAGPGGGPQVNFIPSLFPANTVEICSSCGRAAPPIDDSAGDASPGLTEPPMALTRQSEAQNGIPERVRDTADSFVTLVAAHFKVANLELVADLRSRSSRLAVQLAIGLVALIGYVLLMVGVALTAVPWAGRALAFVLLGGVHLFVALVAGIVVGLKRRRVPQVGRVLASIEKSVSTVTEAVTESPAYTSEHSHARA